MKISATTLIFLFLFSTISSSQEKYLIEIMGGGLYTINKYNPHEASLVGPVKKTHQIGRNLGVSLNIMLAKRSYIGIVLNTQDITWGLEAKGEPMRGVGVSSGSNELYTLRVAGLRYFRQFAYGRRFFAEAEIGINCAFNTNWKYPYIEDTALGNEALRQFSPNSDVLYQLEKPTTINRGLKPLLSGGVSAGYKIGRFLGIFGRVVYQQGFSTIIDHNMSITRKSENKTESFNIRTKGSGVGFQLGLRLRLGAVSQ